MREMDAVKFLPWETVQFPWGAAVRHRKGDWQLVYLKNGSEIDIKGLNVILHDNGIEFVEGE